MLEGNISMNNRIRDLINSISHSTNIINLKGFRNINVRHKGSNDLKKMVIYILDNSILLSVSTMNYAM